MKKLLVAVLLALGISGCGVGWRATYYDEYPAYAYVYSPGVVVVEPGLYYRLGVVDGVEHRFYYRWHRDGGWRYHGRDQVFGAPHGGFHGGHGEFHGGGHGGHR